MHAFLAWFKALNLGTCTWTALSPPQPSFCVALMVLSLHKQEDIIKWVVPFLTFDSLILLVNCCLNLLLLTLETTSLSKAFDSLYFNVISRSTCCVVFTFVLHRVHHFLAAFQFPFYIIKYHTELYLLVLPSAQVQTESQIRSLGSIERHLNCAIILQLSAKNT